MKRIKRELAPPRRKWVTFTNVFDTFFLGNYEKDFKALMNSIKIDEDTFNRLINPVKSFSVYQLENKNLILVDSSTPQSLTENGILAVFTRYYISSKKLFVLV